MRELNNKELINIDGGATITSTVLSTLIKGTSIFLDVGKSLGTSIRRILSGCTCKL